MRILPLIAFLCLTAAWAQKAPAPPSSGGLPDLPDETVVAVFDDGAQFTMGDFRRIYAILPPQNQQMAMRDRREFLQQWAFMRKLTIMAQEQGLDQASPTRESLEYYRSMILSSAAINHVVNSATVEPNEISNYYGANKEKYKQVKVRVIYVSFTSAAASETDKSGKRLLTEEEARAKAGKLKAEIAGGADFVKLVRENSEDETSKAKDGDFGTLSPSDNIPDAIRSAVFALKQGEVSDPVRQANGYYLLRADEVSYQPLSKVRDQIFTGLKQEHVKTWMDKAHADTKVEFPNAAFLGGAAAAAGAK